MPKSHKLLTRKLRIPFLVKPYCRISVVPLSKWGNLRCFGNWRNTIIQYQSSSVPKLYWRSNCSVQARSVFRRRNIRVFSLDETNRFRAVPQLLCRLQDPSPGQHSIEDVFEAISLLREYSETCTPSRTQLHQLIVLLDMSLPVQAFNHPGHQVAHPSTIFCRGQANELERCTLFCSYLLGKEKEAYVACGTDEKDIHRFRLSSAATALVSSFVSGFGLCN